MVLPIRKCHSYRHIEREINEIKKKNLVRDKFWINEL